MHTTNTNISFRRLNNLGHSSTMAVMNPSTVQNYWEKKISRYKSDFLSKHNRYAELPTWLSNPINSNMTKNNIDQIGDPGSCNTADGYTRKANPGPGTYYTGEILDLFSTSSILLLNHLPEAATSATGLCCSWDMNPITENITNPANILVPEFTQHTINASLRNTRI